MQEDFLACATPGRCDALFHDEILSKVTPDYRKRYDKLDRYASTLLACNIKEGAKIMTQNDAIVALLHHWYWSLPLETNAIEAEYVQWLEQSASCPVEEAYARTARASVDKIWSDTAERVEKWSDRFWDHFEMLSNRVRDKTSGMPRWDLCEEVYRKRKAAQGNQEEPVAKRTA